MPTNETNRKDTLLNWDVFITPGIPIATSTPAPNTKETFWNPTSSTLIYGERDAVLVDVPTTWQQAKGTWDEESTSVFAFSIFLDSRQYPIILGKAYENYGIMMLEAHLKEHGMKRVLQSSLFPYFLILVNTRLFWVRDMKTMDSVEFSYKSYRWSQSFYIKKTTKVYESRHNLTQPWATSHTRQYTSDRNSSRKRGF